MVGVAALAIAACGGGDADPGVGAGSADDAPAVDDQGGDQGGTPSAADDRGAGADELATALTEAFSTSTVLDGETSFDGASLAGGDSVVWFWAPWCTICRAEAPEVAEVAEQFAGQVTLIGVPGRGDLDEMREFVDDTGTGSLTHVADLGGDVWSAFGVYGQPAFAFIDDDGSVDVFIGGMGGDALAERVAELVAT